MFYPMKGVCAKMLELEIENDVITKIEIHGGCDGNSQGVSVLALGQNAKEVADKLEGIHCGLKATSCPDQVAKAIRDYYKGQ